MERVILKAPEGQVYTDGTMYGKEIYLAEGKTGEDFYLIPETDLEVEAEHVYDYA